MNDKKLIDDIVRSWKYYKCENCGYADMYKNTYQLPVPPVKCNRCEEMIPFDQSIEDEWLYAVDENNERKRMDFEGRTEEECLESAAKYFGCDKNELAYYKVRNERRGVNCVINVVRPVIYTPKDGDIKIDLLKYMGSWRDWCVINTNTKTVFQYSRMGEQKICYDGIKELNTNRDMCDVEFLPDGKMRFRFSRAYDVQSLFDAFKEYLPVQKVGVLSVENQTKIDPAYKDSHQSDTLKLFKYRDINISDIFQIWKTETDLCFLGMTRFKLFRIPLEQIKYYRLIGEKYYTTDVSGGGGGGSSLKGAVIGGLIAGGTGAVIGSRKGINEVQSSSEVHDEQQLLLYFKNDDQVVHMDASMFDVFTELIPDKDYDIVAAETKSEQNNDDVEDINIKLLKQLASLHDNGILTDEEYDSKKAELLSRL